MERVEFLEKMLGIAKRTKEISDALERAATHYAPHLPQTSLHLAKMSTQLIDLCREMMVVSKEEYTSETKKESDMCELLKKCNEKMQAVLAQQELNKLKEVHKDILLQ